MCGTDGRYLFCIILFVYFFGAFEFIFLNKFICGCTEHGPHPFLYFYVSVLELQHVHATKHVWRPHQG